MKLMVRYHRYEERDGLGTCQEALDRFQFVKWMRHCSYKERGGGKDTCQRNNEMLLNVLC